MKLMQVIAERDGAVVERDKALAEKKAALNERDSAFMQRDIAVAERDAAVIDRDNAVVALDAARGHRTFDWSHYKRQADFRGQDPTALHMNLPSVTAFGVEDLHVFPTDSTSALGFVSNSARGHPAERQNRGSQKKETLKTKRSKKSSDTTTADALQTDVKMKRAETERNDTLVRDVPDEVAPVAGPIPPFSGQELELQLPRDRAQQPVQERKEPECVSLLLNTPLPFCSCTGMNQPCYRWGNGGWQSACCTTTMSMHPLPMNPKKRGYRLPGRKMSAGAFQKLAKRLSQEGVDLSQPIDLKNFWAKHGTNRYVTIK